MYPRPTADIHPLLMKNMDTFKPSKHQHLNFLGGTCTKAGKFTRLPKNSHTWRQKKTPLIFTKRSVRHHNFLSENAHAKRNKFQFLLRIQKQSQKRENGGGNKSLPEISVCSKYTSTRTTCLPLAHFIVRTYTSRPSPLTRFHLPCQGHHLRSVLSS